MNFKEFSENLKEKLSKINIEITEEQTNKFYDYMNLLLEWNKKINLTAITDVEDIILKHFIDSLSILKYVEDEKKVIDVGTGAGLPGISLNIMNSKAEYVLLDSLNKRINFLNEVINKVELKNITTIHSRVEDFTKKNRESFDIAIARAVAPLNVLLEYLLPLIEVGGKCICMKGPSIEEEIDVANKALEILGGKIEKVEKITLPDSDIIRNIIIVKKTKETPKKFPRKAGMASKEPII